MKNFFKVFGLVALICVSFIYTEKTILVGRDIDEVMIKIKEEASKYEQKPTNAQINGDEIIPGIGGRVVDIEKSYKKMKEVGLYHQNYLIYKKEKPEVSVSKNYQNYIISGNPTKKEISLIYILNESDNTTKIVEELKKKKVTATFFITSLWLEKNNDTLMTLLKNGHTVGNLSHNADYKSSDFMWMDTIIKKVGGQKQGYCLMKEKKEEYLNVCSLNKNYTIIPTAIIDKNPLTAIREVIQNGSMIVLPMTEETIGETSKILWHIESKGYKVVTLEKLLQE